MEWIQHLSRATRIVLIGAIDEYLKYDRLQDYKPYPKQAEFHAWGRSKRHRMLRAGNQQGKTWSAGNEVAMHLTGEYPDWWKGKRFDRPVVCWAAGLTGEATRENAQRVLLGPIGQRGTGTVPERLLSPVFGMAKGISKAVDYQLVKHVSGGFSTLKFRNYTQSRETWQGPPVDILWYDEEPPLDMYEEGLARLIATRGISLMTFTPLKGRSAVYKLYDGEQAPTSERIMVAMNLADALHVKPEDREREIAQWPAHQRRARVEGLPLLGSGQIYPFDEGDFVVDPFVIPSFWPQLGGLDFGGTGDDSHPTAAIRLAWDRDTDTVYIVDEYRKVGATAQANCMTLRHWGSSLKWAWPHDGLVHEKGTGVQLARVYRNEGLSLLPQHAQYPEIKLDPGISSHSRVSRMSVERGINDVYERLETGRLRVFSTCVKWLEEQRLYHRKDGKIFKEEDDLMDATRYAIMMLPFAELVVARRRHKAAAPNWQAI